ncbi:glycosyltransferase [Massilia yuzhufengensis]|uniref:UDP:flavonoid glycosyltransferase YjiC, YdhE family n=1 Tax=Massilia yuzhufengensis TaxID=1164594 RepID=A0A1I1ER82_9BURK|nr:nucleotide disphospho-sugar-binding domain-containing protein [Massilia yuzhufengensis]SFB87430.1 UDP:flavonoid glycosyltransferase YjiC, YdhE family [Massilia yuzhufengensis]
MAHFYLCWELGAGLGHAGRLKSIALPLRARGHRVTFVLRDLVLTRRLLAGLGIDTLQAPVWLHRTAGMPPDQASLAEILLACGYLDADALAGLCDGWRALLRLGRPDLVIADYAPTAILAARSLGLPSAAVGPGFTIPPAGEALPPLRSWEQAPSARLRATEARLLASCNTVLAAHGASPMAYGADLLLGDHPLLCTWPELDHFARPGGGPWLGPNLPPPAGGAAQWPAGEGRRVFAYLRHGAPGTAEVLGALVRQGCRVLCYLADVAAGAPAPVDSPLVRYAAAPVSLPDALAQCELAVTHAGEATTAQALLAGRPLLMLPHAAESFLMARRVVQLGAGINAMEMARPRDWDGMVVALMDKPAYREAAAAFAARYKDFTAADQAQDLADRFEAMVT